MSNKNDRYRHLRNFRYTCYECGTTFTYWLVHDDDWNASGFDWKAVCKSCFEKRVPNPRYMTFEEHCQWHIETYGYPFYHKLEKDNHELDRLQRIIIRKFGAANLREYMYSPQKITEPKERSWECTNCHAEKIRPLGTKPPEICEVCGK